MHNSAYLFKIFEEKQINTNYEIIVLLANCYIH